jgi:hypothetical protein
MKALRTFFMVRNTTLLIILEKALRTLTYPNEVEDKSSSSDDKNRFPLSGSIDQIVSDIQRIKAMGVDHIVFGYNFVPIGRDVTKVIDLSKELSRFAR